MMGSFSTAFIVLPCASAVAVAYYLNNWRMAGLVAASSIAILIVAVTIGGPFAAYLAPILSGAAVGALSVLPFLRFRPDTSLWTRLSIALMVTFAVHMTFLTATLQAL